MKLIRMFFLLSIFMIFNILNAQIYTEEESLIPEIKKGSFDKELVEIEGVVEFWERVPQKTTVRYWLRDYWGKLIPIQSVREHPEVNQKYKIDGTVQISNERLSYNNTSTRRFIDEHVREEIGITILENVLPEVVEENNENLSLILNLNDKLNQRNTEWYYDFSRVKQLIAEASVNIENDNNSLAAQNISMANQIMENPPYSRLFYLSILLLLLLIAIIFALFFLLKNKSKEKVDNRNNNYQHREFDQSKLTVKTPQPEQTIGETIKLAIPPQGTLKVLKGRMEIIEGETELKEIRFYSLPQQNSQEFTFGRNTGTPYQHIQIAHPTVSRDQARLLYNNGSYTLINKADPISKNATKINGTDVPINDAKNLKDGDKITMGVISMIYREV